MIKPKEKVASTMISLVANKTGCPMGDSGISCSMLKPPPSCDDAVE
jgi:hypothetical protein